MRILFDDEIFFRQRFGGVSRIFTKLIESISKLSKDHLLFNCQYSENEYLLQLRPNTNSFLKAYNFPLKGKLIRGIYGRYSHHKTNTILAQNDVDIFHPTFYADYYLSVLKNTDTKLVFTVHDLIHEQTLGNPHYAHMAIIKAKNVRQASQIIVVSEYTKNDLLRIYADVNPAIINVIPLAQSLPQKGIKPNNLPNDYILFTGERGGYKNFMGLLKSFALVAKSNPTLHLYCAGSSSFTTEELAMAESLHVKHLIHQAKLTDSELRFVYQHAKLFVFPSTYEGFGIPMLEAFNAGVAVVAHHATSLPEVGADAAFFVDATNVNELSNAINHVLTNNDLRISLIEKGILREQKFTWQNHVEKTMSVYKKALL